uniref:Uncharacterized protein n=1 Tax=Fagus sylvatica TaxID=28930 RepID=A0A2N9H2F4_FAGSY
MGGEFQAIYEGGSDEHLMLGPPECWAMVVIAIEWWWPWQVPRVFSALVMISVPADAVMDHSVTKSTATVGKGNDQLVFHHYLLQLILIWAAMGDFLVFSALASSSSSSPSSPVIAGAAADCFCD